jgi:hypothetical protein
MANNEFEKVLSALLRQGQSASHTHTGSVTSILSKLLTATKVAASKPMGSLRSLLPGTHIQTIPSSGSSHTGAVSGASLPSNASAGGYTKSAAAGSFDAGSMANQSQKFYDGLAPSGTIAGATPAEARRLLARAAPVPQSTGSSITGFLSKIPGISLGISPIISGIMSLFGGHNNVPPALTPFVLPSSVRLDAAVGPNGQLVASSHGSNGLPKLNGIATPSQQAVTGTQHAGTQQAGPQQVNVTPPAMDSRFFLDHSDQIAQAVKDAMLHSSSLNDVITDL